MPRSSRWSHLVALAALSFAFLMGGNCDSGGTSGGPAPPLHEPSGYRLFASPQTDPIALSPTLDELYVANTTTGSISVIDTNTNQVIEHRDAGLDPVSLAVRPDGKELWVSNHVSDTVSVFDVDETSPTRYQIKHTIQDLSEAGGETNFDEPAGIAFASNSKAYVALSSTNRIAVIDITAGYSITKHLDVTAQDPRAIKVSGGRLFVAAFESGNQSQISACVATAPGNQCTLDIQDLANFATSPNLPGETKNIIVDQDLADRDVFVYETTNENLIIDSPVSGVGTLLYGMAVASNGIAYVTNTDARNTVNGLQGASLDDLDNRIFDNRVSKVNCTFSGGGQCDTVATQFPLEPAAPTYPTPGEELATPYGIAISGNDATLIGTAAGSHRIFSMDTSGTILDRLDVGHFPTGVALRSDGSGNPQTAYVLNAFDNTVTVVDVSNPSAMTQVGVPIRVGADPTPTAVRLGRIAFNDARASTSGTFSCGSCHPSGNTDQLLWRIGGACDTTLDPACGDDEARTTMPIRGLKNTLPLHWDGTLGDPFGGGNGAFGNSGNHSDCNEDPMDPLGDHDCFLALVDASLAGVMCDHTIEACDPGGHELGATERDNMATFLASVSDPPARGRRIDDVVTVEGVNGFQDFTMDQGGNGPPNTCADSDAGCHELPLGSGTNSATLAGFDAPSMRGMTDRFLQFSLGPTVAHEIQTFVANNVNCTLPSDFVYDVDVGLTEKATFTTAFGVFEPIYGVCPMNLFQMFEEASTGVSGAVGRQVTVDDSVSTLEWDLLTELEIADSHGMVNLIGNGYYDGTYLTVSYDHVNALYQVGRDIQLTRAQLETDAGLGKLRVTLTGKLPQNYEISPGFAQPLLGESLKGGITGDPPLPNIVNSDRAIVVEATDVLPNAVVLIDGASIGDADITCCGSVNGSGNCQNTAAYAPYCSSQEIEILLQSLPSGGNGTHLLQIQNPKGALSNELPICVGNSASTCQDPN